MENIKNSNKQKKSVLFTIQKILFFLAILLFLLLSILMTDIKENFNLLIISINLKFLFYFCLTLIGTVLTLLVMLIIYNLEFSDDSKRIINKEIKLIEATLSELDEIVRNTAENINASKKNAKKDEGLLKGEPLAVLARIKKSDLKEKHFWDIVINTYFTTSLENYLHNNRHSNKKIVYYANRVRKMAELINNNRTKEKKSDVIDWTRELNLNCYALMKLFQKLPFVKKDILNDYDNLIKLEKYFWENRKEMISERNIIEKIERDLGN